MDNDILKVCGNILEVGDSKSEFGCRWLKVQYFLVVLLIRFQVAEWLLIFLLIRNQGGLC